MCNLMNERAISSSLAAWGCVCLGTGIPSIAMIDSICHQEMSMPIEEKRTMRRNPKKNKERGK